MNEGAPQPNNRREEILRELENLRNEQAKDRENLESLESVVGWDRNEEDESGRPLTSTRTGLKDRLSGMIKGIPRKRVKNAALAAALIGGSVAGVSTYMVGKKSGLFGGSSKEKISGQKRAGKREVVNKKIEEDPLVRFANALGIKDTSELWADFVKRIGKDKIVDTIIDSVEVGSLPGVEHNPGNIKYAKLEGQTDSGIKAIDGGTFANYADDTAGKKAIGDIVTNAASGNSKIYGKSVTIEGFIRKYTNTEGLGVKTPRPENKTGGEKTIVVEGMKFEENIEGGQKVWTEKRPNGAIRKIYQNGLMEIEEPNGQKRSGQMTSDVVEWWRQRGLFQ